MPAAVLHRHRRVSIRLPVFRFSLLPQSESTYLVGRVVATGIDCEKMELYNVKTHKDLLLHGSAQTRVQTYHVYCDDNNIRRCGHIDRPDFHRDPLGRQYRPKGQQQENPIRIRLCLVRVCLRADQRRFVRNHDGDVLQLRGTGRNASKGVA